MSKKLHIFLLLLLTACAGQTTQKPNSTLNSGQLLVGEMSYENLYNMASQLYENGDYLGAYNIYGKALEQANGDVNKEQNTKLGLGLAVLRLGMASDALEVFNELEANGLQRVEITQGQIEAHTKLGHLLLAQESLNKLNLAELKSSHLYNMQGIIHDLKLDHERARLNYELAIEYAVDPTSSLINLSYSYALSQDYETAFSIMETVSDNDADMALLHALKGELLLAEDIVTKSFHRSGLDASAVEQNMIFYGELQKLTLAQRAKAVLLGKIN